MAEKVQPKAEFKVDLTGQTRSSPAPRRASAARSRWRWAVRARTWPASLATPRSWPRRSAAITAAGGTAEAYACDVTDGESVQKVVDAVTEKWEKLHILVNNAGITRDTLIPRMSDEDWDQVIATNLRGTFLFTRAATRPMMQQRYGRIINIASVSGLMGNPGQSNYSASKAGIIGLTRTVAKELASRKVTVNAVAPGFIETEMTEALGPVVLDEVKKRVPAKRLGQVEDVAGAVLFLASDAAGYITGQVLTVDGGLVA